MSSHKEPSYTPVEEIPAIVEEFNVSYKERKSQPISWRKEQLKPIWRMLDKHEAEFQEALYQDMGKLKLESQLFEITMVKNEILHFLNELDNWLAPEVISVPEPFQYWQPTVHKQSKGTCLIIVPWNYPFTLSLLPLLPLIAAGNTGIIKPSEVAPHSAQLLTKLIPQYLDDSCDRVVNGAVEVVTALLKHPFGHILYTGSGPVGTIVMVAASTYLTPVTLELGGKSPVIVTAKTDIALAAKRIAWGKIFNAGQTCMCPDYALVEESVMLEFLEQLKLLSTCSVLVPISIPETLTLEKTYGSDPAARMARLITSRHYERLTDLLASTRGKVAISGPVDASKLFVPPTVVTDLKLDDPVLASEIFGPILGVTTYRTGQLASVPDVVAKIDRTPLGLYIFTEDPAEAEYTRARTWSGGMCVNDVMGHTAVTSLAFGGFGSSGMGSYRGKAGIDTFSHRRSTAIVPTTEDFEGLLEWRYADGDLEEKYKVFKTNMEGKLEE